MKVTFNSYREIAALQNTFLFAEHSDDKIAQIRELIPERAEQCEQENKIWLQAQRALDNAKPDIEYEIRLI